MLCWFVTTTTTSAATTLPVSLRRAREDLIRAPFPSDLVRRIRLRIKRTDGRPDVGYWEAACSSGSRVSTQMSVGAATVGTDQSRCRAHIDRASAPANAHNPPFIPLHARVPSPEQQQQRPAVRLQQREQTPSCSTGGCRHAQRSCRKRKDQ